MATKLFPKCTSQNALLRYPPRWSHTGGHGYTMGKRAGVGAPGGGSLSAAIATRQRTAPATAVQPRPPAAAAAAAPAAAAVTAGTGAVAGSPVTVPAPLPVTDVRRGSPAAALQASETEESRQAALDALERDRCALT